MKKQNWRLLRSFVVGLVASLFLVSCKTAEIKTIIPPRIVEKEASWDENAQNSGIIDFIPGKGFLVTKKAASRYQALVFLYGAAEVPPILPGEGISVDENGNLFLSNESMVNFVTLSDKFKKRKVN